MDAEQRYSHDAARVAAAFADPELYASFDGLPKVSAPEVLRHEVHGNQVELDIRYRLQVDLPAPARAVLDADKLTWVERSVHDLGARRVLVTIDPDHYADRLEAGGRYSFTDLATGGCVRRIETVVAVRAPLVARAVERAIATGLREHAADEVAVVEAFLAR